MAFFGVLLGGVVVILIILFKFVRHSTERNCLSVYMTMIESGFSQKEALTNAFNFFRCRKPFRELSDEDVESVINELMNAKDPDRALSLLLQYCDNQLDATILKKEFLNKLQINPSNNKNNHYKMYVKGQWDGVREVDPNTLSEDLSEYADKDGNIYALCCYENGKAEYIASSKEQWDLIPW